MVLKKTPVDFCGEKMVTILEYVLNIFERVLSILLRLGMFGIVMIHDLFTANHIIYSPSPSTNIHHPIS